MGLLNKLTNNGSNLTSFNGATHANMPGASDLSPLHDHFSV